MKRLKIKDLFTPKFIFDGGSGILKYLSLYDGALTTPLLTGIIDSNNKFVLDNDYLVGFSSDKYISPYLQKAIEYVCDSSNIDINKLYDGSLSDADRTTLIKNLFDDENGMLEITAGLHQRFASKWKHIWDALNTAYNPLENYSMLEERTPDITKTTNGTGTTKTDSETGVFGFNSVDSNPSGTIDGNQTDTITDRTETETGTETLERSGNIGVTTSQQMLQSEFEVRKYDFYKEIYKDIDSILCLKIY